jgi:hypothetical protein
MSLLIVAELARLVLSKIRLSPVTGAALLQLLQLVVVLKLLSVAPVQVQVSPAAWATPVKPNAKSVVILSADKVPQPPSLLNLILFFLFLSFQFLVNH